MRKEQEDIFRKSLIVKAAREVFSENDYPAATIEQIAQKAEIARATLYKYFKTKEDIYNEVIFNVFSEINVLVCEALAVKAPLKDKFTNLTQKLIDNFSDNQDLFRFLMTQVNRNHNTDKGIEAGHKSFDKLLINELKKAIKSREIKNINPEEAVQLFNHMVYGYQMSSLTKGNSPALRKNGVELIIEVFFNGISNKRNK